MKKITGLNKEITGIKGIPMLDENNQPQNVGKTLGNSISIINSSDPIRAMDLAKLIYFADDSVEISDADYSFLESLVSSTNLINFAKAQCLEVIKNAETIKEGENV